jgi:hypothetical protein
MKARRRGAVIEGQTSSTCCRLEKNLKESTAWCLRLRESRAPYVMSFESLEQNAEVEEDSSSVMVWGV